MCHELSVKSTLVITQDGNSALMIATEHNHTKVVKLLLEAGANVDLQNKV